VVGLLWAGGLYYAVTRHGLMLVTPETAARDILSTMADAVLLLDPRGAVVSSNRALTDTLGYVPAELVGKPARSLFRQPERFDSVLTDLRTRESAALPLLEGIRKNGACLPLSVSARAMKTPAGEVKASVWVVRDISRQVENERALREAEESYRLFIDNFQGIAFRATADFQVEFQRGALQPITGYTNDDFASGRVRWRDLIHPDDVERLRAGTTKLKEQPGRSLAREYRIIRAGGAVCWVREIVSSLAGDDDSPVRFTGAIFDVSEHHVALDELMSLSQLRESVIDNAGLWMSVVGPDMRVLAWNRAAEVTTGFDRDSVLGSADVWKRIWPDWRGRLPVGNVICTAPDPGAPRAEIEAVITRRDGTKRVVLFTFHPVIRTTGEVSSFIVLGRDVTERRKAEASLLENEERYRTVVEKASDGIAVLQDGLIRFANTRLADAVGLRLEEIVGQSFIDRIADDMRSGLVERYRRRLAGEDVPSRFETRLAVRGGRTVDVEVSAAVITYEGRPADLVVVRDITERKQVLERETKHARDMAFLSRTAMEFVEMGPSDDIYRFVAEKLKELSGATVVFLNSYDKASRKVTTRTALGFGTIADVAARAIGRDPVGMEFLLPEEALGNLVSGRLVEMPGGLHMLALDTIPKPVCDATSELLGLGAGYSIGFAWGGELYGNASLLMRKGSTIADTAAVEAFVRQAAIALRRRQDEEARPARAAN
jgi:PAS domain S-box-containing protein